MEYTTPREVNFMQYRRCLLEDFIELKQKTPVYVVVSSDHPILLDDSLGPVGNISFNKNLFEVYSFQVHSNIKLCNVTVGILPQDLRHGLGADNYSVTFE